MIFFLSRVIIILNKISERDFFNTEYSFGSPSYTERLVKVKADKKFAALRVLAVLISVAAAAAVCVFLYSLVQLCLVWIAVVAAFCYMALAFTKREFEYIVCDGNLEISCIYGKRVRRKVFDAEIKSAYKISRFDEFNRDNSFQNLDSLLFACDKDDENAYIAMFNDDKNKKRGVLLSCDEKMLKSLKLYNKSAFVFSKIS